MNTQNLLDAEYNRLDKQIRVIEDSIGKCPEELIVLSCQIMCVSICGSLEQCLKAIFTEYANQQSDHKLENVIAKICTNFRTPKPKNLEEFVGLLDPSFSRHLRESWEEEEEQERSHLGNLVKNRIDIAHQTGNRVDLRTSHLRTYLNVYLSILSKVHNHFLERE